MDVFEWDDDKRESNLRKHGVDFVLAAFVFESRTLVRADERMDYGEQRMIALGETNGMVLVVVYVMRGDTTRIISARKAGANEREQFWRHRQLFPD